MKTKPEPTCGNCRFYRERDILGRNGVCMLNPPTVTSEDNEFRPEVDEGDFCSHHKPEKP